MAAAWKLNGAAICTNSYNSPRKSFAPVAIDTGNNLLSSFIKGSTTDQCNGSGEQIFFPTDIDLPDQSLEEMTHITSNQLMDRFTSSGTNSLQFHATLSPPACQVPCSLPTFDSCIDNCSVFEEKKKYGCMPDTAEANMVIGMETWFDKKVPSTVWEDIQTLIDASVPSQEETSVIIPLSPSTSIESEIKSNDCPKNATTRKKKTSVTVKDDKYWERRKKNTLAARRTRRTKREKELKTEQRLEFLEIENTRLLLEMSCLKEENKNFKQRFTNFVKEAVTQL